MLSINLRDSVDSFIKTSNANGEDSEVIFTSSSDSLIRDLRERISFWKSISTSDPFNQSQINEEVISQSIKSVCDYLISKYPDDRDIINITSRLTTEFYNSVRDFNDKKLADLMVVFFNHFAKIINLLENSSDTDLKTNKEKVKTNLMIFPGISANQVQFACIEGTSVRIQEASLAFQKLPIDQQLYQDHVSSLAIKLIENKFPKSSVTLGNQIHLGAFIHSLFTINHQDLDRFYRAPDPNISLYDVLKITREFKTEIKTKINQLTQEIASDVELSAQSFYQESVDKISYDSLNQHLAKLKEKYGVELNIYDLMKNESDPENFTEDDSQIFKNKLKTSEEIKELILQKLTEKFPQLGLVDDTKIQINQEFIVISTSPITRSSTALSLQQDQFDFLAQLDIQRDVEGDRDLSLNPKKIADILALLFPAEDDPNKSQKIKTGLMITHILARDLANKDPIFFMILCDQLKEILKEESLTAGFDHFVNSIFGQNHTPKDRANLGSLLEYLDSSYNSKLQMNFAPECNYLDYKKFYNGNFEANLSESNIEIYQKLAIQFDHLEVYDSINSYFLKDQDFLTDTNAHRILFSLRQSLGNRISKSLFSSSKSSPEKKSALTDFVKQKDENQNTIFNISNSRTNDQFFIDLLASLGDHKENEQTVYKLLTSKNTQGKNAIETAVDSENFSLFMVMLDALDEKQITDALADQNTLTAIANGINQCLLKDEFHFIKRLITKIIYSDPNNQRKIDLLSLKFGDDKHTLTINFLIKKELRIFETILSEVNNENKLALLNQKTNAGLTPLYIACQNGHANVIEKIFASLDYDKKIELLKQQTNAGFTPLHIACHNGHANVIEKILASLDYDKKIELLKQQTNAGLTPLYIACQNGYADVVEKIFASLDDDKKIELLNQKLNASLTPLYIAFQNGHANVIEKILASLNDDKKIKFLEQSTYLGSTPLHLACKNGHANVVEKILASLDDDKKIKLLNQKTNGDFTPLHIACQNGHADVIEKILASLDDDKKIEFLAQSTYLGSTPLHLACQNGHANVVEKILASLDDDKKIKLLAQKNDSGFTPLHLACQNGHANVVEKILASLDDDKKIKFLTQRTYLGFTPLHLACQNGHANVVEKILASLDDDKKIKLLEQRTHLGSTPLHLACQYGHADVVEKIFASLDDDKKIKFLAQRTYLGSTPLHLACQYGHADVVEKIFASLDGNKKMELIQIGTWNFFSLFNFGFTPLLIACKKGHGLVIEKMLEALEIDQRINFLIKNGSSIQATTFGNHDSVKGLICCMIDIIKEKPESSLNQNFFETFANLIKKLPETELGFLANLFCNNTQNGFSILHDASSKSNDRMLDLIVDTVKKITRENTKVLDLLINKETHNDQDSSNLNPDLDGKTPLYFAVKNLFSNDDSKTDQQTQKELKIIKKLLANILTIDQKTKDLVLEKFEHKNFKIFRDTLEKSNIAQQEKNFINSYQSIHEASLTISRPVREISHQQLRHMGITLAIEQ